MIVWLFLLVAVMFGAVAAASVARALLRMTWSRRFPARASIVAVACGAVSIAALHASPPRYERTQVERMQRALREFAPALEQYRARHGQYPPTLEAAGIATPWTIYGALRYRSDVNWDNEPYFQLSFGDMHRNGFETWWESGSAPDQWAVMFWSPVQR